MTFNVLHILNLFDDPLHNFTLELKRNDMTYEPNIKSPKHVADYMKIINESPHDTQIALLVKYGKTSPYDMLLSLNFNSTISLDLPPGLPSTFKRDEATNADLFSPLASQIGRLKSCLKTNPIKKVDKERVFIQVIESIPPCDADILALCKDKELTRVYPNITADLIKEVYPHWVK